MGETAIKNRTQKVREQLDVVEDFLVTGIPPHPGRSIWDEVDRLESLVNDIYVYISRENSKKRIREK